MRVVLGAPGSLGGHGDTVILDEQGRETLRLTGISNVVRLDAGNMLAYKWTPALEAELIGVPVATMRKTQLGTVPAHPLVGLAADGSTVVAIAGREVVVYRIS